MADEVTDGDGLMLGGVPPVRRKAVQRQPLWNVLGQNPPNAWDTNGGSLVSDGLDELRANGRRCAIGGCDMSWRGDFEGCRRAHGKAVGGVRNSGARSPSPRRRKQPVYPNGPHSPSKYPRARPAWSLNAEQHSPEGYAEQGGLYYPSSPLQTGRYSGPSSPLLEGAVASTPDRFTAAEDHIGQQRQRLHATALDFYRATARNPQPTPYATSANPTLLQSVLDSPTAYSPSKSTPTTKSGVALSPSVFLARSPLKNGEPSDTFHPRQEDEAYY